MTPVASVTGKNAVLNVFPECVTYKKFGKHREAVAWYPQVIRVDFRMMRWSDTGFIKVRAPGANFDFVTHRLHGRETPDCPRALALKHAYDMICQYWHPIMSARSGYAAPYQPPNAAQAPPNPQE